MKITALWLTLGLLTTLALPWGGQRWSDRGAQYSEAIQNNTQFGRGSFAWYRSWLVDHRAQTAYDLRFDEFMSESDALRQHLRSGAFESLLDGLGEIDMHWSHPPPYTSLGDTRMGWPFRSVSGWGVGSGKIDESIPAKSAMFGYIEVPRGIMRDERWMPYHPLWPGLIANTLFYAGFCAALFYTPRFIRHSLRRRRGQCAHCGYSLVGLATATAANGTLSRTCPECGHSERSH